MRALPSVCHASESWHPVTDVCKARFSLRSWIPAFAGMTMVLVICFTSPAHATAMVERDEMVRSITASGTAERKIAPDEAHVQVNFGATNLKLETAKAEHDKKLRDVMVIAEKAGIDKAQMKTLSSSTQPHYSWENNKQNFKGYRVQTMIDITVKKIDAVGELIEKLSIAGLETGGTQEWGNLLSVNYTISEPEKIRDEMLADAIKNARKKAENMASAAGASIGNVIQINEGGAPQFNFPQPMLMARGGVMAMDAQAAKMESAPPVGEQSVNANVNVVFELR